MRVEPAVCGIARPATWTAQQRRRLSAPRNCGAGRNPFSPAGEHRAGEARIRNRGHISSFCKPGSSQLHQSGRRVERHSRLLTISVSPAPGAPRRL